MNACTRRTSAWPLRALRAPALAALAVCSALPASAAPADEPPPVNEPAHHEAVRARRQVLDSLLAVSPAEMQRAGKKLHGEILRKLRYDRELAKLQARESAFERDLARVVALAGDTEAELERRAKSLRAEADAALTPAEKDALAATLAAAAEVLEALRGDVAGARRDARAAVRRRLPAAEIGPDRASRRPGRRSIA
jgi:hypothetical protein